MKILNIGSINIDNVYSVDKIMRPGETVTSLGFDTFPGGKGLNQSVAVSRAGAKIFHAGCIGADGSDMVKLLKENGVDTSYVKKVSGKTGHAVILVELSGQNSIVVCPGANYEVSREHIDAVLENFGERDMIILQNEISNVGYIVDKAYEKGMCIILNPSPINRKIDEIDFGKVSYLIMNETETEAISGKDEPEEALGYIGSRYPKVKVVLTLGEKGSVYSDGDTKIYQPAFKTDTVDTTAAGDTFTGYFVKGIAAGEKIEDVMRKASLAAAVAVSKMGAVPSIPCEKDI